MNVKAKETWNMNSSIEEKFCTLRSALTEAAKEVLGKERRRHPDWFRENIETLEPLFHKRNQLYAKYLSSKSETDRRSFAEARRLACKATTTAKNAWFQSKAEEAQKERFGGKKVWQCIRDMQRGRRELFYQVSNYILGMRRAIHALQLTRNINGGEGTPQMYLISQVTSMR